MPRTNIHYDNTCFYPIVCKDLELTDFYVGHTTDFRRRKNGHKSKCCIPNDKTYNLYVYEFIREHGGWSNWDMLLIESCKCEDALDARKKERLFIESLHASLNSCIPSRTKPEWEFENKEHTIKRHKEYYVNNKEHKHKLTNKYYQNDKEHMTNHRKAMYLENKENILNDKKVYYLANKEKINERRCTKVECPCGGCFTLPNKSLHFKTTKHLDFVQSLIPE